MSVTHSRRSCTKWVLVSKSLQLALSRKKKHPEDRGACSAGLWKDSSKQTAEKKEKETKVIIVNKLKTGQELSEDSWRR